MWRRKRIDHHKSSVHSLYLLNIQSLLWCVMSRSRSVDVALVERGCWTRWDLVKCAHLPSLTGTLVRSCGAQEQSCREGANFIYLFYLFWRHLFDIPGDIKILNIFKYITTFNGLTYQGTGRHSLVERSGNFSLEEDREEMLSLIIHQILINIWSQC